MSVFIPIVASLLIAGSVFIVVMLISEYQRQAGMRRSLAFVLKIGSIKPADEELAATRVPSLIGVMVTWLGQRLVWPVNRQQLREHLAWDGKPTQQDVQDAVDRKVIYGVMGLCFGFLLAVLLGGWWWTLVLIGPTVGFFLPDLLIYNSALRRTDEILLNLPDALDLLDLCVSSGLSLQAALNRVSTHQRGPVADEFGRVLQEMRLGVSRAEAFEAMAKRTRQVDLRRFVSAVLQADKLGIPIASVLREQSKDMRVRRRERAREMAQKVPVKILGPLMLCLLPGLFIIILGPAVITAVNLFLR